MLGNNQQTLEWMIYIPRSYPDHIYMCAYSTHMPSQHIPLKTNLTVHYGKHGQIE